MIPLEIRHTTPNIITHFINREFLKCNVTLSILFLLFHDLSLNTPKPHPFFPLDTTDSLVPVQPSLHPRPKL